MGHFTQKPGSTKPSKPYDGFPLFAHATGRWAKKIRGKLHYFGRWDDGGEVALDRYEQEAPYLHAGRAVPVNLDGLTVRDLCNHFLTAKKRALDTGDLHERSFTDYHRACDRLVDSFGADRLVDTLRAIDFGVFRTELAKGRGPHALGREIQLIRTLFKFGFDAELMDRPVRFGPEFKKPAKKVLRRAKQQRAPRILTATEIRAVLAIASVPMRAMILLGINSGLGNNDLSSLPRSALDLDIRVLDYPRAKTSVERRCTLWPETVQAIQKALKARPEPKHEADHDLVFITKYGRRWVRWAGGVNTDGIGREFAKYMRATGAKGGKGDRHGVNFYSLRHTLETIGAEVGDQATLDRVMGHESADMATHHRKWQRDKAEDKQLDKVTNHVRKWLFAKK